MQRLKFTVAYDGTLYSGWQVQAHSGEQPPTIQGELESRLARIAGEPVLVHGAGRTDAGVHAEAQVFHCDLPLARANLDWKKALNATLPRDIRITAQEAVSPNFHARKSALKKRYAYSLWSAPQGALPRLYPYVWSTPPLHTHLMLEAAALLVGTRDFKTLQNSGSQITTTVRTLYTLTLHPSRAGSLVCPESWPVVTWIAEGNGFLRQMVRNMMGLLVWVGRGKIPPDKVPDMLLALDRKALPSPAAPARGLTLLDITY